MNIYLKQMLLRTLNWIKFLVKNKSETLRYKNKENTSLKMKVTRLHEKMKKNEDVQSQQKNINHSEILKHKQTWSHCKREEKIGQVSMYDRFLHSN